MAWCEGAALGVRNNPGAPLGSFPLLLPGGLGELRGMPAGASLTPSK